MNNPWKEDRERYKQLRRDIRDRVRDRIREDRLNRRQRTHVGAVSVRLIAGLLVVILGVLFLASNLQLLDIYSPMRYFWAAAFVAIGAAIIIERRTERGWQWGIAWIVAGLWTFAYQHRWIDIGFWQIIFPLAMLAVGAYLVRHALTERQGQSNSSTPGSVVQGVGVLSSSELKPTTLERAELFALMGGVKLDLFGTQLVNNASTIHVAACMGGIEICAPSEWVIVNHVVPIMGAFVDKRRPAATVLSADATKTLTIDGFVLMGGIEVKN
jgi:predicted membrane protein